MPDGKLRAVYWENFTALAAVEDILDTTHPDYSFPSEDEVEYTSALHAMLIFADGSRLIVHSWLEIADEVQEHDYAYVYLDAQGNRVFQYDDAPHHPGLPGYPHHMHKGRNPSPILIAPGRWTCFTSTSSLYSTGQHANIGGAFAPEIISAPPSSKSPFPNSPTPSPRTPARTRCNRSGA